MPKTTSRAESQTGSIRNLISIAPIAAGLLAIAGEAVAAPSRFDVNDVSILFPAPRTPAEVNDLISADDFLADGVSPMWPREVFDQVIATAPTVGVTGASNREFKIEFEDPTAFSTMHTWKIAGIRFDPTAPGASEAALRDHGCSPEIRIIFQPVTVIDGEVKIHDYTAHLVFDFIKGRDTSGVPPKRPRAIPDQEAYSLVISDLKTLKATCENAGVITSGELNVHPGFSKSVPEFRKNLRTLLAKHLNRSRLSAVSFMGVRDPEPWIFFALFKKAENQPFERSPQTRMFAFPDDVSPLPSNRQFTDERGVSTAVLFPKKSAKKLDEAVFPGDADPLLGSMKLRDIPDIIANPKLTHFFTADCFSCHSESTRRSVLKIPPSDQPYHFELPAGISGVSERVLPTSFWNVRNFGWFTSFPDRVVSETATRRTGNESAESADFINRFYLNK